MKEEGPHVSLSASYRYHKANRAQQLSAFLKFKQDYSSCLSDLKIAALKKVYNHGNVGRNVDQRSVLIDRVGKIKLSEVSKVVTDEELLSYLNQRLLHLSEEKLRQKQSVIWIIDLGGPIMQLASKRVYKLLEDLISNLQQYFPGMLHKLYFVNTPILFDTIWGKIGTCIDENIKSKIIFLNDEFEELYSDAHPDMLPEFLGGPLKNSVLEELDDNEANREENEQPADQDFQNKENQIDLNSLKAALSGLKLGSNRLGSVAQTPLNTEADD